jgi:hypothetical protein
MYARCPYYKQLFTPSRYHPDQIICSQPNCQRRRRAEYHRWKIQNDPEYAQIVLDSQNEWRRCHPDYPKKHRKKRLRPERAALKTRSRVDLQRLLEDVKNNIALDLKHCAAEVWIICRNTPQKNIFASAEMIVIEAVTLNARATD